MTNVEKIYWLTRLDVLNNGASGILAFSIVYGIFIGIMLLMGKDLVEESTMKKLTQHLKYIYIPLAIISGLVKAFVPTKEEMILIWAGGSTLDYVQENKELKEIPDKATKVIINYLDEKLNEVKED